MSRLSSAGVEKVNVAIKNSGRNKTDRYWAEKALVSPETWNRFRNGKVRISPTSFISCCKVLELDHSYDDNFEMAIALFTELSAPRLIQKVRGLMASL